MLGSGEFYSLVQKYGSGKQIFFEEARQFNFLAYKLDMLGRVLARGRDYIVYRTKDKLHFARRMESRESTVREIFGIEEKDLLIYFPLDRIEEVRVDMVLLGSAEDTKIISNRVRHFEIDRYRVGKDGGFEINEIEECKIQRLEVGGGRGVFTGDKIKRLEIEDLCLSEEIEQIGVLFWGVEIERLEIKGIRGDMGKIYHFMVGSRVGEIRIREKGVRLEKLRDLCIGNKINHWKIG